MTLMNCGKFIYILRIVRTLSDKFDIKKYIKYKLLENYINENLFILKNKYKIKFNTILLYDNI